MSPLRVFVSTLLAMLAFAANSLLCRMALKHTAIDPASFTMIRLVAGAMALWLIVRLRGGPGRAAGNWLSALALFVYAAAFSFAYVSLSTATGALLLFGAVQFTMIGFGLHSGERLGARQCLGLACASAGLIVLLLPGVAAPSAHGAASMLVAGIAWGVYSLRGRGVDDPIRVTCGNFLRAAAFAVALAAAASPWTVLDVAGTACAVASGALASGVGYAIWYAALPGLKATSAATVQLSVPVIAAGAGVAWLGEPISLQFVSASAAVLGGIALAMLAKPRGA